MKKLTTALFVFCLIAVFSCKKGDGNDQRLTISSLTFGKTTFARENSIEYYRLTSQEMYKDSTVGPAGQIVFAALPLSQQKHLVAKPLLQRFPAYLIDHPNQTFGCPNCSDQGMIYLETSVQGVAMKWYIDPTNFPSELSAFLNELNTTLDAL